MAKRRRRRGTGSAAKFLRSLARSYRANQRKRQRDKDTATKMAAAHQKATYDALMTKFGADQSKRDTQRANREAARPGGSGSGSGAGGPARLAPTGGSQRGSQQGPKMGPADRALGRASAGLTKTITGKESSPEAVAFAVSATKADAGRLVRKTAASVRSGDWVPRPVSRKLSEDRPSNARGSSAGRSSGRSQNGQGKSKRAGAQPLMGSTDPHESVVCGSRETRDGKPCRHRVANGKCAAGHRKQGQWRS